MKQKQAFAKKIGRRALAWFLSAALMTGVGIIPAKAAGMSETTVTFTADQGIRQGSFRSGTEVTIIAIRPKIYGRDFIRLGIWIQPEGWRTSGSFLPTKIM